VRKKDILDILLQISA